MTMNDLVGKEFTASFFASGFFVSDVRCKATLSKKNMFASENEYNKISITILKSSLEEA